MSLRAAMRALKEEHLVALHDRSQQQVAWKLENGYSGRLDARKVLAAEREIIVRDRWRNGRRRWWQRSRR